MRGSTSNIMDDVERAIDDGINVVKSMTKDARFVPGAGAIELRLADALQQCAAPPPHAATPRQPHPRRTRRTRRTRRAHAAPWSVQVWRGAALTLTLTLTLTLSRYGEAQPGLDQYAITKFGLALEVVPRTLAENAGIDAAETIAAMYKVTLTLTRTRMLTLTFNPDPYPNPHPHPHPHPYPNPNKAHKGGQGGVGIDINALKVHLPLTLTLAPNP